MLPKIIPSNWVDQKLKYWLDPVLMQDYEGKINSAFKLESMGYQIGIDYRKVAQQSRYLEKIIGNQYFSGEVYKKY